jgi:hypothetical protein
MVRFIFYSAVLLFFTKCNKDDEVVISVLEPECLGINMVGTWSVTDSVEIFFLEVDSFAHHVYYSELTLYENGVGNQDFPNDPEAFFFQWVLQCNPDTFIMSVSYHSSDSIFDPKNYSTIRPYDILINNVDYKKMKRTTTGIPVNQRRTSILDLIKM